jgi:signal transduction histidine kinase
MSLLGTRERLGRAAASFNFLVGVAGLLALTLAAVLRFGEGATPPPRIELLAVFFTLFVLARLLRFEVPPDITASLILPLQLAAILLLGPVPTAWLALPAFLIEVVRERPLRGLTGRRQRFMLSIIAFNLGMEALLTLAAGFCWLTMRPTGQLDTSVEAFGALLATFVVFKGLNELLMITGHWLRGVRVREYLSGARTSVVIETLTLPLAALLVLVRELPWPAFYLFVFALLLAAVVMQRLTITRHDLERRVRDIQAVSEVGRAISADIELDSLLETIHERCSDVLPSTHFYIALWRQGEERLSIPLEVVEGVRQEAQDLPLGEGLTSHVILSRKALLVRDLLAEREDLPAQPVIRDDQPNRTWLGVPLLARGEVVGAIVLQAETADAYDENDLRVLDAVASQAAISVMNARLHHEALHALRVEAENRELKALNAKKSDFVNMVSHQFRTPLTTVIGYANLLLDRAKKAGNDGGIRDLERHLDTVHSESRRLAQMVEELLNLSRIRAGRLPLTLQDFDLRAVIRETVAAHELLAGKRGLDLKIENDEDGPVEARGDSNFIRQVLGNLVANAVKYAPEGSAIAVQAKIEGEGAVVEVVDEGPGVPEEALELIFDEFYRAEGPTLDLPGTGLGLSICRGILEAHGGGCWAERRGPGTAFCFVLPRAGTEAARNSGPVAEA